MSKPAREEQVGTVASIRRHADSFPGAKFMHNWADELEAAQKRIAELSSERDELSIRLQSYPRLDKEMFSQCRDHVKKLEERITQLEAQASEVKNEQAST